MAAAPYGAAPVGAAYGAPGPVGGYGAPPAPAYAASASASTGDGGGSKKLIVGLLLGALVLCGVAIAVGSSWSGAGGSKPADTGNLFGNAPPPTELPTVPTTPTATETTASTETAPPPLGTLEPPPPVKTTATSTKPPATSRWRNEAPSHRALDDA